MKKILIVEDELSIRNGIQTWLEKSGYNTSDAENGEVAIDKLKKENFDLVVLDVMMPKVDGYEVLEFIRTNSEEWIPVIMLTAKGSEDDKIYGLKLGADDYMAKPFSNRELEARISANLRRQKETDHSNTVFTQLFVIDEQKYIISKEDIDVELTRKEMDLLKFLIINEGIFIKKEIMLSKIWGNLDTTDTRTLDIHISKLRKKLEKLGVEDVIITKRGVGYGFVSKND